MQGVLYVSHGSRVSEATAEAMRCIASVKADVTVGLQEICFLELASPSVEQGIERLVSQGASRIAIVPVLLLSAGHYYKDIPDKIALAKKQYPFIAFTYGQPLGVQGRFIDVLTERIAETQIPIGSATKILLVGRGSRNPQTKKDIEMIGNKLQRVLKTEHVEVCYLAACGPSFDEKLQSSLETDYANLIVVPYLWFTGILMRSIDRTISELVKPNRSVVLCQQLGDHPVMKQALKERVYESFEMAEAVTM